VSQVVKIAGALMRRGVLVDLCVRMWPAKMLKWESRKVFSVDSEIRFAPPVLLAKGEELLARIDKVFHSYSYRMGRLRFVPSLAYPIWKADYDETVAGIMAYRDKCLACWEELKNTVGMLNVGLADAAWRNQHHSDTGSPPPSFVAEFSNRISAAFPSKQSLLGQFVLRANFFPHELAWMSTCDGVLEPRIASGLRQAHSQRAEANAWDAIESTVSLHNRKIASRCDKMLKSVEPVASGNRTAVGKSKLLSKAVSWADWAAVMDVSEDAELCQRLAAFKQEILKVTSGSSWTGLSGSLTALRDYASEMASPKTFVAKAEGTL